MKRTSFALLILCSCLAAAPYVSGQTTTKQDNCETGIEGRTTSIQGWIIPKATVRLINKQTKESTTTETDGNGEYLACLKPGTYDLVANAPGYNAAWRKSIKVETKGRNVVDIVMKQNGEVVDSLHP